jgi:hypothetical protein
MSLPRALAPQALAAATVAHSRMAAPLRRRAFEAVEGPFTVTRPFSVPIDHARLSGRAPLFV